MYNIDEGTTISYSTLPILNIHLRSRKILEKESPLLIEEQTKKEKIPKKSNTKNLQLDKQTQNDKMIIPQTPPFPERLVKEKNSISLPEFDVLYELTNVCVKIPLLQAIKDIPIYTKEIKELCLNKTGRQKKDPQTIHVIGNLAGLMSNTIFVQEFQW